MDEGTGLRLAALSWFLLCVAIARAEAPSGRVPGVVIDWSPATSGIYIGSPSIVILANGHYLASHDEFGPQSSEHSQAITKVFESRDRGVSWTNIARLTGQFWSTLFAHGGSLYILGTDKHHGNAIIRRSADQGRSWTSPTDSASGLLRGDGQYHCAPMPVVEHQGRLWRPLERRDPPVGWGRNYCAGVMSASVEANLLDAANWRFSNFLRSDTNWLEGKFGGWLEGNFVVGPDGRLFNILRVETPGIPEKAALVEVARSGDRLSFDPETGFVDFPGGAKKFTIRPDPRTGTYWALATIVRKQDGKAGRPGRIRNALALTSSADLRSWVVRQVLLHHPDISRHGFQYVDWHFEGEDIIAACRTSYDDGMGGAHNNHDANYLTFHRIENFREFGGETGARGGATARRGEP